MFQAPKVHPACHITLSEMLSEQPDVEKQRGSPDSKEDDNDAKKSTASNDDDEDSDADSDEQSQSKGRFSKGERKILFGIIREDPELLRSFLHQSKKRIWDGKSWMHEIANRFNDRCKGKRTHDAVRHHLKLRRPNNASNLSTQEQEDRDFINLLEHTENCSKKDACARCLQLHRLRVKKKYATCGHKLCDICDHSQKFVLDDFDVAGLKYEVMEKISFNQQRSSKRTRDQMAPHFPLASQSHFNFMDAVRAATDSGVTNSSSSSSSSSAASVAASRSTAFDQQNRYKLEIEALLAASQHSNLPRVNSLNHLHRALAPPFRQTSAEAPSSHSRWAPNLWSSNQVANVSSNVSPSSPSVLQNRATSAPVEAPIQRQTIQLQDLVQSLQQQQQMLQQQQQQINPNNQLAMLALEYLFQQQQQQFKHQRR